MKKNSELNKKMYSLFGDQNVTISYSEKVVSNMKEEVNGINLIKLLLDDGDGLWDLDELLGGKGTLERNGLIIERRDITKAYRVLVVTAEDEKEEEPQNYVKVDIVPMVKTLLADNMLVHLLGPGEVWRDTQVIYGDELFSEVAYNAGIEELVNEDINSLYDVENEDVVLYDDKRDLHYNCLMSCTGYKSGCCENVSIELEKYTQPLHPETAKYINIGVDEALFNAAVERLKQGKDLESEQDACEALCFQAEEGEIVVVYGNNIDLDEFSNLGNF